MKFWESSAIVPLVVPEKTTTFCRKLLKKDPQGIVWALSATEVYSALCRKNREKGMDREAFRKAKKRCGILMQAFTEVTHYELVRKRAHRLLEIHPLRAADALQLAAALVAFEEETTGVEFVTFDLRLSNAAEKEGFSVIGPEEQAL